MKTTTLLALGGIGFAAWWLSRGEAGPSRVGIGGDGAFGPDFNLEDVDQLPDFKEVTELVGEGAQDFFYDGFPPSHEPLLQAWAGSTTLYREQIWQPASKMSLGVFNGYDMQRVATFLGGKDWKRGIKQGCLSTKYEKLIEEANERLLTIAEGLDIGTEIGVGLASVFGFGAGAKAADSSFGFGRGAIEQREAMIDLANVPTVGGAGLQGELAFGNTYQFPLQTKEATERNPNTTWQLPAYPTYALAGGMPYGILVNVFKPNMLPYDDGWSDDGLSKSVKIHGANGIDYVPVGMTYPWNCREMGCHLRSLKKRSYIRARMYRCLDMVQATVFPSDPLIVTAGGLVEAADGSGDKAPGYVSRYVSHAYTAKRFGKMSGSIFPLLAGDKVPLPLDSGARTDYVPYKAPVDAPVTYAEAVDITQSTYVAPHVDTVTNVESTYTPYVAPVAPTTEQQIQAVVTRKASAGATTSRR